MGRFARVAAVVLAAMFVGAGEAARPVAPMAGDRIVVMISLDGLAGFYFDDPKAEMPVLRALAKEGAMSSRMRPSTPSVTWPNHTSLVTGATAGVHGVTGNNYFDRVTGKPVALISDPRFDKVEIVKVPTIYDVAHEAGMKTAAIRWPAARSAPTLDWTIPDMNVDSGLAKYSTPALLAELKESGTWVPKEQDPGVPEEKKSSTLGDDEAEAVFEKILKDHRPQLGLLHLARVDHDEHQYGPRSKEAYEAIAKVDAQVGHVWEQLKKDWPGRATLVIVSDHGFSPIERQVFPNVVLREAGLAKVAGNRIVGGDVRIVSQGGAALVYISDKAHRDEIEAKVKAAFEANKDVSRIVMTADLGKYGVANPDVDPHAPDMVLFAREGAMFGDTAAGSMSFRDKPERLGTHGHDPDLRNLKATFVAWGPEFKAGVDLGEIQNLDVAPTLAKIMGLELPKAEGHVLSDALK